MQTQRGSSGATFADLEDRVLKSGIGNGRVGEQGRWLLRHQSQSLPSVYDVVGDTYLMEKLTPLPVHLVDVASTMFEVADILTTCIWSQDPNVKHLDPVMHAQRLKPLRPFMTVRLENMLEQMHGAIAWDDLERCLTHGDPILDNLMLRDDGQLVLIDPIPATTAIPDLRSVDLGRIIQSLAGYEHVRYPRLEIQIPRQRNISSIETLTTSPNEMLASIYWALVHTLRSMRYVDRQTVARLHQITVPMLMKEARWML